jgi:acetate kinase
MPEIILSINAGSSSVKISVYKVNSESSSKHDPTQLAEATISGLTAPPASLKYARGSEKVDNKYLDDIKSQEDAFRYILDYLVKDEGLPEMQKKEDIHFSCHRVVHGGGYDKSQIIDKETYDKIEELSDLAPL